MPKQKANSKRQNSHLLFAVFTIGQNNFMAK
jgi:hypothetical protein